MTDGRGGLLASSDSNGALVAGVDDNGLMRGWQWSGGTSNSTTFESSRMSIPETPQISLFRNRAYDSRTGRWLQEDPLGASGGINLYQFNGNNPATFTDPFGLCPTWMRDKKHEQECVDWDQKQVAAAIKIIEAHRQSEQIPEGQPVSGTEDTNIRNACKGADNKRTTNRACITTAGVITVNADRAPENIAASIEHERVHLPGNRQQRLNDAGPFGERCATVAEQQAEIDFHAQPDHVSPRLAIDPRRTCH